MENRQILAKRFGGDQPTWIRPHGSYRSSGQCQTNGPRSSFTRRDPSQHFPDTTEGMIKLKGELENSQARFKTETRLSRYLTSAARRRGMMSLMSPRIDLHDNRSQSEDTASAAINQWVLAVGNESR